MADKIIEITEEFQIPGTKIILEAGDKIQLKEMGYAQTQLSALNQDSVFFNVQIRDFEGNKTNWIGIDREAVQAITAWFETIHLAQ